MKEEPEVVELDVEQMHALLDQFEQTLGEQATRPFRLLLQWHQRLVQLIEQKNVTLGRLRRLLFGASTERTREVAPPSPSADQGANGEPADGATSDAPADTASAPAPSSDPSTPGEGQRRRRPGHGRLGAAAYTGCPIVEVSLDGLREGDLCLECGRGTLYRQPPSLVVRLIGQPPVGGLRYQLQRLRCGLCGKVYTAELPPEAGEAKHDVSVASVVATLRYSLGMPWTRIEALQRSAGIPLPCSVQWEIVRDALERGPLDAYQRLLDEAAQGELVYNDDTKMRIQELSCRLQRDLPLREDQPERRGVFTSGIVSSAAGRPDIALFFTGPRHAGENLRDLLRRRAEDLPPPTHMCDGLSRNLPGELQTIVANCLAHGRRNFYDLAENFPEQVLYVLNGLKQVYQIDAQAKEQRLSPEERLRLHQRQSQPVMDQLHAWLEAQFEQRLVEPNSSLGQAITYLLKHWDPLTLFLRRPGAPLDNNLCERALKMAIRHRKNSLFYKTQRGALVGDVYMSLIHTCRHSNADPLDYLTQVQRHHERVQESPGAWLPWNYRQQLADDSSPAPSARAAAALT
jgi:transposase